MIRIILISDYPECAAADPARACFAGAGKKNIEAQKEGGYKKIRLLFASLVLSERRKTFRPHTGNELGMKVSRQYGTGKEKFR